MENTIDCIASARAALKARKDRSAWDKGVTVYALELLDGLKEAAEGGHLPDDVLGNKPAYMGAVLDGAASWDMYSWGGCSLIYNADIADRLCCPSVLKKTRGGERRPNSREEWLDVQARALSQAASRLWRALKDAQQAQAAGNM